MIHPSWEKSKILIVDDNPNNRKVLLGILQEAGFELLVAWNGEDALRRINQTLPDLILLDAVMPGLDGPEVCRRLQAREDTRQIPVILMAALMDIESKNRGFEYGAVDFISKPVERRELMARVRTHLLLHYLYVLFEAKNSQLQETLAQLNSLQALLPVCPNCHGFRDDEPYRREVVAYLDAHPEVEARSSLCLNCVKIEKLPSTRY